MKIFNLSIPAWCLVLVFPAFVLGQDTPPTGDSDDAAEIEAIAEPASEEKNILAIRNLLVAISNAETELEALRQRMSEALPEAELEELNAELKEKTLHFEQLTDDLGAVATGIDPGDYDREIAQTGTLSSELEEFLRPIVAQLKDLTARPREMEDLRAKVLHHQRQIKKANEALSSLNLLLATASDETIVDTLKSLNALWVERLRAAENDLSVAEFKLEDAENNRGSIFAALRDSMANFFRSRGWNFLTAVFAFFAVWIGIRVAYRLLKRFVPALRRHGRNFYVRLAGICIEILALLGGIGASILVLYSASDWVLLGLFLIFLAGFIWTGKRALPLLYEQAKLLLNLGSVREGERVIVDGMPWMVKRINVYTDLVNPALLGGHLRVPMTTLTTLHSRPFSKEEAWFPTAVGDWVELSDGTRGELARQTPHWVTVRELGGAKKGFRTMDFLSLSPRTISAGFRIRSTFGIDYQHQAIATTEVPKTFRERIEAGLVEAVGAEEVLKTVVLFKEAGSSSLDFVAIIDLAGSAAPKRALLECLIQQICVDVCNEKGWVIPFTQVTLHQATPAESAT